MTKATTKSNVTLVTIALFVATFMAAIEGTIVSTAMPTIVGDLRGVSLMNWVFSIFLLTNAIATPIYGKLADSVGRKPMFIGGILIFIFGSVMSGLSHSMIVLIFGGQSRVWVPVQSCQFPIPSLLIFTRWRNGLRFWASTRRHGGLHLSLPRYWVVSLLTI